MNIAADISPGFMRTCRLGDLLDFRNEIVHPRDKPTGSALFVGLEHIERDTGVRIGSERINLREMTGRRSRFHTGDIVYGYLRPYLNKVWIAEFDGICSVDQYVFAVRPKVDRNYVARFLRSAEFLKTAPIGSAPGQLPRIRSGEIAATLIPLPDLDAQRRIASILDKADELRRKRKRSLDLLNNLSSVIFQEMFGGALRDPLLTKTLSSVTTEIYRYPTYFGIQYEEKGVPEVRGELIRDDGTIADDFSILRFISQATSAKFPKTILASGDLVMSVRGTIGKIGRVPKSLDGANMTANLIRIAPDRTAVDPDFLWFAMRSPAANQALMSMSASTTIATVKASDLRNIPIVCPPLDAQRRFASVVNRCASLSALAVKHREQVEGLFSSLQSRAFSGQL